MPDSSSNLARSASVRSRSEGSSGLPIMNVIVLGSESPLPPPVTPVQPARVRPRMPATPSEAICRDFFMNDFLVTVVWNATGCPRRSIFTAL